MKSPLIKLIQMAILPNPPLDLPKFDGAPGSDSVSHIDTYAIACVEYLPYDDIMLNLFSEDFDRRGSQVVLLVA